VREIWLGKPGSGEAFGRISNTATGTGNHQQDPFTNAVLLDSCLHVFGAALGALNGAEQSGAFVPATIHSVMLRGELPSQIWSHIQVKRNGDGRAALANIRVLNEEGELLAGFDNLELRRTLSMSAGAQAGASAKGNGKAASTQVFKTRSQLLEMLQPLSKKERIVQLSKWLSTEIKDTLGQAAEGLDIDRLPPSTAFLEIGLDSLLVTELQRRIQEKLEFRFKPMQGLGYQSIESMAEFIHDEVLYAGVTAEVPAPEAR
jgi:acyl carrier protein